MTEVHQHSYDLTNWSEGRCACGDLGMYPPVEQVSSEKSEWRSMWAYLPPERGPAYWCQVCGAHFMSSVWAYDHYKTTAALGEVHVVVQLRQER